MRDVNIYRYWSRGEADVPEGPRQWRIRCLGASNESLEAAHRVAEGRARDLAAAIARGEMPDHYGYADRPVREEIVQEPESGVDALITRNAYGSLILNTGGAMFIDLDEPPPAPGGGLLGRMFGRGASDPLDRIRARAAERADLGIRLYRTAAGFRGLVTSRSFDPTSNESEEVLRHFASDPLYIRLCRLQESYRARLTAKCWRCAAPRPPARYPFRDAREEERYRAWEDAYHAVADGFAACHVVEHLGPERVAPAIAPVLALHDELAVSQDAPLA